MIFIEYLKNGELIEETLLDYCLYLGNRNNAVLYKIEEYLNKKLVSDEDLKEIRKIILSTSADVARIPERLIIRG